MVGSFNSHDGDSRTSMYGGAQPIITIMKYLDYIFYVVAMIMLLLSITSVVMSFVEWRGIAHLLIWAVAAFVSFGLVRIAKKELKEMEDDEL